MIAHDQAGALAENGLLAPVDLGDMTDQFVANALAACTFNGELLLYALCHGEHGLLLQHRPG